MKQFNTCGNCADSNLCNHFKTCTKSPDLHALQVKMAKDVLIVFALCLVAGVAFALAG